MSVQISGSIIELRGVCPAGDAEILWRFLTEVGQGTVDWRACDEAHSAVVQILLGLPSSRLLGPPKGAFLRTWVAPALAAKASAGLS